MVSNHFFLRMLMAVFIASNASLRVGNLKTLASEVDVPEETTVPQINLKTVSDNTTASQSLEDDLRSQNTDEKLTAQALNPSSVFELTKLKIIEFDMLIEPQPEGMVILTEFPSEPVVEFSFSSPIITAELTGDHFAAEQVNAEIESFSHVEGFPLIVQESSEVNEAQESAEVDAAEESSEVDDVQDLSEVDAAAAAQAQALKLLGALLSQLNHSPYVFGTPTTVIGNIGSNTQLTGDWGGDRLTLPQNKVFFDIYSTTVPQGVVSGGRSDSEPAVLQNFDAYLNVVELWPGAILHAAFQSKIGSDLDSAGTLSPVNYGSAFPVIDSGDFGLVTEYYLFQSLSANSQLIVGKVNATNLADLNVFANNYRHQFQNAALNNNLMLGSYLPPSTWVAGLSWQPTQWLNIVTAVGDPNGSAENLADDFFNDVVVAQEFDFAYKINGQPGNFRLGWLYSSVGGTDFSDPIDIVENGTVDFRDPIQEVEGAVMVFLNFDQYLFTLKPRTESGTSLRHFNTPRGLGIFGRFGIGPESSNFISTFWSLGLGAKGIIPGREDDQFGIGWYYLNIADGFQDEINDSLILSTLIGTELEDETGLEMYYNLALTPALQITLDAQYIFNPFLSRDDHTFILGGRIQMNF